MFATERAKCVEDAIVGAMLSNGTMQIEQNEQTTQQPDVDQFTLEGAFTNMSSYPLETHLCCRHDGECFSGVPILLPVDYNDQSRKFKFANHIAFCSFSCAFSYVLENRNLLLETSCALLSQLAFFFGVFEPMRPAKPKECLQKYGGSEPIEQWRQRGILHYTLVTLPPIEFVSAEGVARSGVNAAKRHRNALVNKDKNYEQAFRERLKRVLAEREAEGESTGAKSSKRNLFGQRAPRRTLFHQNAHSAHNGNGAPHRHKLSHHHGQRFAKPDRTGLFESRTNSANTAASAASAAKNTNKLETRNNVSTASAVSAANSASAINSHKVHNVHKVPSVQKTQHAQRDTLFGARDNFRKPLVPRQATQRPQKQQRPQAAHEIHAAMGKRVQTDDSKVSGSDNVTRTLKRPAPSIQGKKRKLALVQPGKKRTLFAKGGNDVANDNIALSVPRDD